jgi:uncharacterized protein (TIGR04255 family)
MTHPILQNPPLVEIVAELRWGPGLVGAPPSIPGQSDDEYIKLGIEVGKSGYTQLERVIPSGFPAPGGMVVYRYRKSDEKQHTLFQLGHGIFTANALPPYNSWKDFRPVIAQGLNAAYLAKAIPEDEPAEVLLRYIDAFHGENLVGRDRYQFMIELLGLQFLPPPSVHKADDRGVPNAARFAVEYPTSGNGKFSLEVGIGEHDGKAALIMNTTAQSQKLERLDVNECLTRFDTLHDILHNAFVELIERVQATGGRA